MSLKRIMSILLVAVFTSICCGFGKLDWKAFGTETPVTEVKLSVIKN